MLVDQLQEFLPGTFEFAPAELSLTCLKRHKTFCLHTAFCIRKQVVSSEFVFQRLRRPSQVFGCSPLLLLLINTAARPPITTEESEA